MNELKKFEGKKVYLKTLENLRYTGDVEHINDDFISIIDKFGILQVFNHKEIAYIREERI